MHRVCILFALATTAAAQQPAAAIPGKPPIQGITISTHGIGRDWGTDRIVPCLRDIKAIGSNWVAIHPYASIHRSGRVTWDAFDPDDPPAHLVRPIEEARALGLEVFVKPHLAYWGSPFSWRGAIGFDEAAKWQRFFTTYRRWIVAVAAACKDAGGFAVGTELDKTIHHEKEWRGIVAAVRAVTKAPLTYAANWTDYQRVPFWDAVDIIGVQAYFPVTERRDATAEDLRKGWKRTMQQLRTYAARHRRNVVFTELGYTTSFDAGIKPWESKDDGPAAVGYQLRCMRVALEAVAAERCVEGAFLWKWFPPPRPVGRDFPLATPEMQKTLRALWKGDG